MSRSDQWVSIIFVTIALIYVSVLIIGSITHRLVYWVAIVNLLSAGSVLIYWVQKQFRISQHLFEGREMTVLSLEAVVVVATAYFLTANQWNSWQRVSQYIVFGLHFIMLLLFILFMLTFKMKRLF